MQCDVATKQPGGARGWGEESGCNLKESCFSAATGTEQQCEFTPAGAEADMVKNNLRRAGPIERTMDLIEFNGDMRII